MHTINLDEVMEYLSGTGTRRDEATAQCPACQETVTQTDNICPACNVPIVWINSPVWKRKFGRPDIYMRRLLVNLEPVTPLEMRAVMAFGNYDGKWEFSNVTQQKEFRILAKKYPHLYIEQLIEWGKDKGWQAFVSAVRNSDNYAKWMREEAKKHGGAYA